jgi:hypothetical protein
MHGNDLADQMRAATTVQLRTKKWWKAIFNWVFDSALINAFLLFRQTTPVSLSRREFIEMICRMLCGRPAGPKSGKCAKSATATPKAVDLRAGGVMPGLSKNDGRNHAMTTGDRAVYGVKPPSASGDCMVCTALSQEKQRFRTNYYCFGCRAFFHLNCYVLHHSGAALKMVDGGVVEA